MNIRKLFKHLKVGDTLYHINPMSCGNQANVRIKTIVVDRIERKFLGLFGTNIIYFKGTILKNDSIYLNDMDNYSCKFTTTCLDEAKAYLKTVHAGNYGSFVSSYHSSVNTRYR